MARLPRPAPILSYLCYFAAAIFVFGFLAALSSLLVKTGLQLIEFADEDVKSSITAVTNLGDYWDAQSNRRIQIFKEVRNLLPAVTIVVGLWRY